MHSWFTQAHDSERAPRIRAYFSYYFFEQLNIHVADFSVQEMTRAMWTSLIAIVCKLKFYNVRRPWRLEERRVFPPEFGIDPSVRPKQNVLKQPFSA